MTEPFLVGAAEIDITPTVGLPMDGYMAREGVSIGVHDPLMAQVLVLELGSRRAAMVTLDTLGIDTQVADLLRGDLAGLLQTSPEAILICASHTHAGPSGLRTSVAWGSPLNNDLVNALRNRIIQAARQAVERRQPASPRFAYSELAGIGGDRNSPDQSVDTRLSVLSFEGDDQQPIAILFHYACHPTVLPPSNLLYSADFPGAARRAIQERAAGVPCLFVNGAAGNVSTRFHRRGQTFEEVERLGQIIGDRVWALLLKSKYVAPTLAMSFEDLDLPVRKIPEDTAQVETTSGTRLEVVKAEGRAIQQQLRQALASRTSQAITITALKIGPVILLAIPGEAFNELATTVREASPGALVAGYTNGYFGYFPTKAAVDAGTYEALSSPFDERAHEMIGAACKRLIQSLEADSE
jgi:hypothetical protein